MDDLEIIELAARRVAAGRTDDLGDAFKHFADEIWQLRASKLHREREKVEAEEKSHKEAMQSLYDAEVGDR